MPHSRRYLISKGHLVSGTGDNAGKSSSPSTPCLAPLTWPADHDIQRDYLHSIIRPTPLSSLITRTVSYQGESQSRSTPRRLISRPLLKEIDQTRGLRIVPFYHPTNADTCFPFISLLVNVNPPTLAFQHLFLSPFAPHHPPQCLCSQLNHIRFDIASLDIVLEIDSHSQPRSPDNTIPCETKGSSSFIPDSPSRIRIVDKATRRTLA